MATSKPETYKSLGPKNLLKPVHSTSRSLKQAQHKLPHVERGSSVSRENPSSSRYSYIKKADYDASSKQVVLKQSDKTKSDLISFMLEINRLHSTAMG